MRKNRGIIALICFILFSTYLNLPASEIHDAVKDSNLVKVKKLVKENPKLVNKKDNNGCTALHCASEKGYLEIAKYLIDNKT